MADHPLRPANHRCLGRPLPYQLANDTRAHLTTDAFKKRHPLPTIKRQPDYSVLASLSRSYPKSRGRLPTRYSPVRHSTYSRKSFRVRLACVRHAASVHSEPESNSPVELCSINLNNFSDSLFNCQRPCRVSEGSLYSNRPSPSSNFLLRFSKELSAGLSVAAGAEIYPITHPLSTTF